MKNGKLLQPSRASVAYKPVNNSLEVDEIVPQKDQWVKSRDEWHKDSHPMTKNEDGTPKVFYHGAKAMSDM